MSIGKRQQEVTLLDLLIDGFEKNEVFKGFHRRVLPMPDEESARERFSALAAEAERWQGPPLRKRYESSPRFAVWADLQILQARRAVVVRVRAPRFSTWWNEAKTWEGGPLGALDDWVLPEGE